jgi:hypothetical protein
MAPEDFVLNSAIGIGGGIIASILTLIGDRWLHRKRINEHLRRFAGTYAIEPIVPVRDTTSERVVIRHSDGCRFSISASGGPTGGWTGVFVVREDFFDVAHGIYRYPGTADWGQHELLLDTATDAIFVYGVNRSRPGFMEPFSYTLVRCPARESKHA